MSQLNSLNCRYDEQSKTPLTLEQMEPYKTQLEHWKINQAGTSIEREFLFKNYYHTMNFVNAIAWIANKEAHHPDLEVNYGRCLVTFTTHDSGNTLTINDLICAAKVSDLIEVGDFGPKLIDES